MTSLSRFAVAAAATVFALAAHTAHAAGIDPNTFIVGHPASPRWGAAVHEHAGQEHPALRAARLGQHMDPNQYLVQPPASTQWTVTTAPVRVAEAALR